MWDGNIFSRHDIGRNECKSRTNSYQDTKQDPKDLYVEYLRKHLLSGFQYNQSACSPGILDIVQEEHPAMEGLYPA